MIAEISGFIRFAAIAFALVLVLLRVMRATRRFPIVSAMARTVAKICGRERYLEKNRALEIKKCPNCEAEVPLSTLICEGCEFNFVSGMIGHGHMLLPSPEPPAHEISRQKLARRA